MKADRARRLCLIGATGLVGHGVIEAAVGREDLRLVGVARREMALPAGARMEFLIAEPERWAEAIAAARADVLICALGTTMARAGSQDAFRKVDHDLVLASARHAREAGIDHMVMVSSVGADAASNNFYLRTKGEVERALGKLGFRRLDLLRPSLLVGPREESRPLERLARGLAPLTDLLLHGSLRRYRSIRTPLLADAILALAQQKAAGRFVHDRDALLRALRRGAEKRPA